MDKIIIKSKSLNLKRRAITIGKILKEKEEITSDGRQSATKAQDQRAPQSGAVSGKKTVFLRSFYDFKAVESLACCRRADIEAGYV